MNDNFGDRMKSYEAAETQRRFMPMLPVYARIDGKTFSSFTRGMARPYELALSRAMIQTTKRLVEETQARIGYTQSDEISLTWLQSDPNSEMLFGGKIQKWVSILPSLTAAIFNQICLDDPVLAPFARRLPPYFDCRAFQLPNTIEGANAFLWREQDATKNAISMAARAYYSTKQLFGKSGAEMQEMLFQKGVNFNDYPAFFKRGTFLRRVLVERSLTQAELARIPEKNRPAADATFTRSQIVELDMPKFSTVLNRPDVIYNAADPLTQAAMAAE